MRGSTQPRQKEQEHNIEVNNQGQHSASGKGNSQPARSQRDSRHSQHLEGEETKIGSSVQERLTIADSTAFWVVGASAAP